MRYHQPTSRRTLLSGMAGAGLAGLAACGPRPSSGGGKIRLNTGGFTAEGGVFLAADRGYFKQEGVEVELVPAPASSSADLLTQLAGGNLELAGFAPTAALFNALARGVDIVGILPLNLVTEGDRSTGIVVRNDLIASGRYRSPKDLKGMKVAVLTAGGIGNYNVLSALRRAGLGAADIDLTTLPFPDTVVALSNRSIDAAHLVEPFITAARAKGVATLTIPAWQTTLGLPSAVLFASGPFVRDRRPELDAVVRGLLRGQRDYARAVETGEGRDALLKTLQTHTAIKDMAVLGELSLPKVSPDGAVNDAALTALQQYFQSIGVQQTLIDSAKVFDRSIVEAARKALAAKA